MEYVNRDFDGLLLNVRKHPLGTDLFKVFPLLDKYHEFIPNVSGIKKEYIIRYIVYAFDKNSPLVVITDVLERRVEALTLAGFVKQKSNKFSPRVDEMVRSLIPEVNHMIIRYCMLLGDINYSVMTTYEDSLVKELDRLINFDSNVKGKKDDTGDKKRELIANINTLRKDINELRAEFLADNVDYFLSRSLSEFSESKRIDLSPEYYARVLKDWDNVSRYFKELSAKPKEKPKPEKK